MAAVVGIAKAVYDYASQQPNPREDDRELSIEEHEMLYILDRGDDGWWKVKKKAEGEQEDGETGLVPANYVQEATPLASSVAMYDYDRQTSEEVSFQEGSHVDIFDKDDPDWFLVGVNGQYGFAPSNYLEESETGTQRSADLSQQTSSGTIQPESTTSLPPLAPPLPPVTTSVRTAPASTLFGVPTRTAQPDFTDHTALQSEDEEENAPPTPQRPVSSQGKPPMAPRPAPQNNSVNDYYTQQEPREASPEPQQVSRPYKTWSVQEVDGKKKKKKGTLGLGSDEISWAPDKSSESIQTWPINALLRYSAEKKHIFIDLQGPPKAASFDFHAGSSDAAQSILSLLGELAGAARMPGIREVAGALNAPLPALPQNSGLARKERESGFPAPEVSDDELDSTEPNSGTDKIATVLYDFEAQGDDEVTVRAGAKVVVLDDKASPDWWKVRAGKREGVIPADYLELASARRSKKRSSRSDSATGGARANHERSTSRPKAQELKPQATGGKSKPDPNKIRSWTDRSKSFKVDAQLLGCSDGKIHLHKSNGVKISVPVNKMSLEDIEYVEHKTGRSLREEVSTSGSKDTNNVPATQDKETRRKEAARNATASSKSRNNDFDWFDFFLGCGCDPNVCQRYTSAFERDGLSEDDITSLEPSMLRNLGLKEGDILKVGRAVDAKLGRQRDAPASFGDVLIRENADADGTGLLTGPGGELKNNTRRGRPERGAPSNNIVDEEALKKAVTANDTGGGLTHQTADPAPPKPARPQSTGAPLNSAMEDLSLLAQPLVPIPAPAVSASSNFAVPPAPLQAQMGAQFQSVPPQQTGQPQTYPSQQFLQSIQQMQPQRTASAPAAAQFMPQTSFGSAIVAHRTGGGDMNHFVPPPLYGQQTGYQPQYTSMQTGAAAPYQDPFKTGSAAPYQDPFKTGFAQVQPIGAQSLPFGSVAGYSIPMQQTGYVQQAQQTGFVPVQLPGFVPQQQPGFMSQQTGFMPQQTGFVPQQTAFMPSQQPQYNSTQAQPNTFNIQNQQTGFNPAQPFGSSALPAFGGQMMPQQTGFPQQTQQAGYGAFNGYGAMPQQQSQPQMSAGMLKLQQMMSEAQQQQSQTNPGFQQQQQPQGFQPVAFGRPNSAGPSGRKANLGNATADNPFGF